MEVSPPSVDDQGGVLQDSQLILHPRLHPVERNLFLPLGSIFLLRNLKPRAFV